MVTSAIALIVATQGRLPVTEINARLGTHPRSLERAFARWIGLTPKLYSRVIRLSTIFRAASGEAGNLSDLSFHAGYYDQPHFHREFKAFTGEAPSKYPFAQPNMANLFLNRA
nr:helix-turn-helix domain-containing protein [Luteimonas saliphila]